MNNRVKKLMSNKKFAFILGSPIILPTILALVLVFGMFIGCGWFFVGITFFVALASAITGVMGIFLAYINIANGIGAILLAAGIGLIGLGLTFPLLCIAKEFYSNYRVLSKQLVDKFIELKNKVVITHHMKVNQ